MPCKEHKKKVKNQYLMKPIMRIACREMTQLQQPAINKTLLCIDLKWKQRVETMAKIARNYSFRHDNVRAGW